MSGSWGGGMITGYLPTTTGTAHYPSGVSHAVYDDPDDADDHWDSNPDPTPSVPQPPKSPSLMNTVIQDLKTFIREHRTLIYSIVVILLVDHFFLGNKLTARIKGMVEKLLGSVESKVHAVCAGAAGTAAVVTTPAATA